MANTGSISPPCHDTRECFAANYIHGGYRVCRILNGTYYDDTCPFCKKRKEDRTDVHEDRSYIGT